MPRSAKSRTLQNIFSISMSGLRQGREWSRMSGGARRDRTDDLLLAKQALSQLSYGPVCRTRTLPRLTSNATVPLTRALPKLVGLGRFELPTSPLSGVRSNQLSYRPLPRRARIEGQPNHAKWQDRQTRTRALITLIEERETKTTTSRSCFGGRI